MDTNPQTQPAPTDAPAAPAIVVMPKPERDLLREINEIELRLRHVTAERDKHAADLAILVKNPLISALRHAQKGAVLIECADGITALCRKVTARQKPASFALNVAIEAFQGTGYVFKFGFNAKPPKEAPVESVLYLTESGEIVRNDPAQAELPGVLS